MMAWTTRHYRFLARLLTKRTVLYTEMVTADCILHRKEDLEEFIGYNDCEHPLIAQLGGNDPTKLAEAAAVCEAWGYDEINLNCGCPSPKVSGHCFGARLMLDPPRVRDICIAMREAVRVPVTVKCRLGADDKDSFADLVEFVQVVRQAGITHFIIHARKCLLNGLSPTENRRIPPLRYDWVGRLAALFPELEFSINGGFVDHPSIEGQRALTLAGESLKGASEMLPNAPAITPHSPEDRTLLRGLMVGRAAYNEPWLLADFDRRYYQQPNPGLCRREVMEAYIQYAERVLGENGTWGMGKVGVEDTNEDANNGAGTQAGNTDADADCVDAGKGEKAKGKKKGKRKTKGRQQCETHSLMKPILNLFKGEHGGKSYKRVIDSHLKARRLSFRAMVQAGMGELQDQCLDARAP